MISFFDFDRDIVYAPGMTCVFDQLFDGIFTHRWKVYPFRKRELGFRLYDKPAVVIENLFRGESERSATLFAEPERFLQENGRAVVYDVLAVESRWLSYNEYFFEKMNWNDLRARLEPFRDRRLVFLDCQYPHYGYLQNIRLLRTLTHEELQHQSNWQTSRHRLLDIFTRFAQFRYISVDALAGYHGYRNACMDQPDHYTPDFREIFKSLLASHSDEQQFSNIRGFVAVEDAVTDRESEIELIEGMRETFKAGEVIMKLNIRVKSDDPLMCDTEMIATWVAQVDGHIAWRQNFTLDTVGIIRPILNASDINNNKIVLKSFDDMIKIATFGRYEFILAQ